jgi:hypothetical protein
MGPRFYSGAKAGQMDGLFGDSLDGSDLGLSELQHHALVLHPAQAQRSDGRLNGRA